MAAATVAATARATAATRGARQAGVAVAPPRGSTAPGPWPRGPGSLWAGRGLTPRAPVPARPVGTRRRTWGFPFCQSFLVEVGGGAGPAVGFPWRSGATARLWGRPRVRRAGAS